MAAMPLDGTFDINYAPNDSEKGAFRVVGHASDQDDPTDYVYYKKLGSRLAE